MRHNPSRAQKKREGLRPPFRPNASGYVPYASLRAQLWSDRKSLTAGPKWIATTLGGPRDRANTIAAITLIAPRCAQRARAGADGTRPAQLTPPHRSVAPSVPDRDREWRNPGPCGCGGHK